jgi:hypothetical protein
VSPTWPDLLQDNQVRTALLLLGAAGLFSLIFRDRKESSQQRASDEPVKRPSNTALWRRWWWNVRPPHDVMRVDGLVIDRTRKPHCAWLGPTGAGKSASVATVRLDGKRVALVATPDLSDPLVDAVARLGGFRWTACVSTNPVNFLIGSPTEVAERLTEVFRSGGVGAWKRAARRATADVIRQIDAQGEPRTLQLIGERLEASVKADRELRTVCAGWCARFLDLADQFGTSIGPDGVDIADLLNRGISVLLDNDSFDHPSLGGDVVALGLAEAKRCASLVPNGFRLIFEEAGQLGERIDLAEPFHRAGRRRKIAVDDLTQAESDLNDGISANISTRVYFAQELKALQKIAADRLGLPHTHLDPANMRDFSAYISHGKIRRLVKFPKPPKPSRQSFDSDPLVDPQTIHADDPHKRRIIIEQIGSTPRYHAPLPPPRLEVQALLGQLDRTGHCFLWTGGLDKDGYGITRWDGRSGARVHRVVYELTYGPIPYGEDGKQLDLDHTCRNRRCARPEHLEPVTRAENVRRRWRVKGVGQKAI